LSDSYINNNPGIGISVYNTQLNIARTAIYDNWLFALSVTQATVLANDSISLANNDVVLGYQCPYHLSTPPLNTPLPL